MDVNNFNVEFKFIDNMADSITRAEQRWNGTTVWVSRRKFAELTDTQQKFVLMHEFMHAIHRQILE